MSPNRIVVLALTAGVAVVCFAAAVAVVLVPDEAMRRFDTSWVRAGLLLTCFLLASLLAVELYWLWHDPTPLRMARRIIAYVMTVGSAAAISPFGFFGLQKVQGFGTEITLQEAGLSSTVILVAVFAALILLQDRYARYYRLATRNSASPAAGS